MALHLGASAGFLGEAMPGLVAGDLWEALYAPGDAAPAHGVYRCEGCGEEVTCARSAPLPAREQHAHYGPWRVQWRLVAKTAGA
ncbi:hypothetical protein [Pseudomonas sp. NPDC007930]|uniref:hypothetical protein n=1 Tax=Pseudomonas sp. NPDC007930 TaxID=3364417 RepID=UPI0036F1213E